MQKDILTNHYLDLRGLVCPLNFVKCCLALESLPIHEVLKVDLDLGESETSVVEGLRDKGYQIKISYKDSRMVTIIISSGQK